MTVSQSIYSSAILFYVNLSSRHHIHQSALTTEKQKNYHLPWVTTKADCERWLLKASVVSCIAIGNLYVSTHKRRKSEGYPSNAFSAVTMWIRIVKTVMTSRRFDEAWTKTTMTALGNICLKRNGSAIHIIATLLITRAKAVISFHQWHDWSKFTASSHRRGHRWHSDSWVSHGTAYDCNHQYRKVQSAFFCGLSRLKSLGWWRA